jgi:hypothetical protein
MLTGERVNSSYMFSAGWFVDSLVSKSAGVDVVGSIRIIEGSAVVVTTVVTVDDVDVVPTVVVAEEAVEVVDECAVDVDSQTGPSEMVDADTMCVFISGVTGTIK